jgi:hypothetical protein
VGNAVSARVIRTVADPDTAPAASMRSTVVESVAWMPSTPLVKKTVKPNDRMPFGASVPATMVGALTRKSLLGLRLAAGAIESGS